jgi:ATP-binding cassette subfamily B protein
VGVLVRGFPGLVVLLAVMAVFSGALLDGLATQLGPSWLGGIDLSGGQWQKLALGRAMMRIGPLLLLLDEPTAALDADTEHLLFERWTTAAHHLRQATGAVTVLVSHRFSTVRMADLIVVLDRGRVVEVGSHPELLARRGLYAELFELQARSYR